MAFSSPTKAEAIYRFWRLKRLIAFCTILPLIFFAFMSLIGFGSLGTSTFGLLPIALVCFAVVAGHAVFFPNANQETVALSVTFSVLAVVGSFIAGSIFGWILFLLFAFFMIWSGQHRILTWQASTKTHSPNFAGRIKTSAPLTEARAWFPLRPGLRRGQFTCGLADENGLFPVWFDTGSLDWLSAMGIGDLTEAGLDITEREDGSPREDDGTASFYAEIEEETPLMQRTAILEADGTIQAVTEHRFKETGSGCIVTETESAAAFPWAQTLFMWLADFQTDGLVHSRDLLEKRTSISLRAAHSLSLLALFSGWIMKRFMLRGADPSVEAEEFAAAQEPLERNEVPEKLKALLRRLGPDYEQRGYTEGPLPLVTIEEFFDGNDDDGSFQGATVETAHRGLERLRERDDVADIRLGITQWEGPSTWPLAELIYIVTSAQVADVKTWLQEANIWVDTLDTEKQRGHREDLSVPDGHQVVCAWID